MVSNELIANTRSNMLDTLRYLACSERQCEYRHAVPYVHVPTELVCQWEQHSLLLKQPWFHDSLAPDELDAALQFDTAFNAFRDQFERALPDFEVLWKDQRWTDVGIAAAETLTAFAQWQSWIGVVFRLSRQDVT